MSGALFTPIRINRVAIKNRVGMAPMYVNGLVEPDGRFSQRAMDYFEERAKGGTGLIIAGIVAVENEIERRAIFMPTPTSFTKPNFRELAESMHYFGAKLFIQLTAGLGRNAVMAPGARPVSASAVPCYFDPSVTCRELATEEVERLVRAFGEAAAILDDVGVDGIEIHGHEGYLIDQFATALWNRRGDKYGGDLEGRLRFAVEILQAIRRRVRGGFAVTYRYGLKHYLKAFDRGALPGEVFQELGRDVEESVEMARLLERAGYDGLHVDCGGSYNSYYWAHPPLYFDHGCGLDALIGRVKQAVRIPVLVASRFDLPALAERVVREGLADMVVLGRGLLADPDWTRKVREGRAAEIRPCIACDLGCQGRLNIGGTLSCAVNPAAGRERIWALQPARRPKEVLVVGGGLAGMEAARVLAERGHRVTLVERSRELGGHLLAGSVPEFKKDLRRLLAWYRAELKRLGVEPLLGTEADPSFVAKRKPDAVLVATGSRPLLPRLPGVPGPGAATAVEVLLGRRTVGERVLVAGGGLLGCEVALWLARQGKQVTLLEKLERLMPGEIEHHANKEMLIDLLRFHGVTARAGVALAEVTAEGARLIDENRELAPFACDTVVLAIGMEAEDGLARALQENGTPAVHEIGDCQEPRLILNAVWDAYKVANAV